MPFRLIVQKQMRCVVVLGEKIEPGLFFVTQGIGRGIVGMNANALRMIASAGGGLIAIYGFGLGISWFFAAVAVGFCLYAATLVYAVFKLRTPDAARAAPA